MPPQNTGTPVEWEDIISDFAKRDGIAPSLALAVANKEARDPKTGKLNPFAVGDGGQAIGLFQLHPGAAKDTDTEHRENPIENIRGGVRYLKQLNARYKGDVAKTLQAYNGGMDNVDKGTVSPEAQAYAAEVIANITKGMRESATANPTPSATNLPMAPHTPLQKGMASELSRTDLPDSVRKDLEAVATGQTGKGDNIVSGVTDILGGLGAGVNRSVIGAIDLGRSALGMDKLGARPAVQAATTPPDSFLGKGAYGAETLAEYILPSGLARKGIMASLSKLPNATPAVLKTAATALGLAGGEAASTYGVSKVQGVQHPGMAAALAGGTAGVFGAGSALAPALRRSAGRTMERLLNTVASGDPAAEAAAKKVLPIALDDELLRLTQGRWAKAVDDSRKSLGRRIGAEVAGPLGDEIVPTAPLDAALDQLEQKAVNYVPVNSQMQPIGATAAQQGGPYALHAVPFNQRMVGYINQARKVIAAHGPDIRLRDLVNWRRDWDDFVFASKDFMNRSDIVKQYEARTKLAVTDAVRGIIEQDPRLISLEQLDNQYHLTKQLYSLISDASLGKGGMSLSYFPPYGLSGAVQRRLMTAALNSPSWRLMTVATKLKLSKAIAAGNTQGIRSILGPVLGASAAHIERSPDTLLAPDVQNVSAQP